MVTLCPECTRTMLEGVCYTCKGTDYGQQPPIELDEKWIRLQQKSGVVDYWNEETDESYLCDLNREWWYMNPNRKVFKRCSPKQS